MRAIFNRNAVVLGLLAAVGPFAIDMYLPAFPAIASDLGVDAPIVQYSLTSYFAAMALSQVVYGPVSDVLGRKAPLYFGLILYVLAAIGCGLSTSVTMLIVMRFLQGVGGCAAMVITRAIVRDLHTGAAAARLLATIMLVFSISPMLAPVLGTGLTLFASWRFIFAVIAGIGLLALALTVFMVPETRPMQRRIKGNPRAVAGTYLFLLRNRPFLAVAFIGGFAQASFFAYLGGSATLYQEHYGLSSAAYSGIFAFNAVAFIGGAQTNSFLVQRFGLERMVLAAVTILLVISGVLFGLEVVGIDHFTLLSALLFVCFACLGSVIPATAVLALDPHGPIAGTAAALMGTIQLMCGAGSIALVSVLDDGTAMPMVSAITVFGAAAFVLSWLVLPASHRARLEQHAQDAEAAEAAHNRAFPTAPVPSVS